MKPNYWKFAFNMLYLNTSHSVVDSQIDYTIFVQMVDNDLWSWFTKLHRNVKMKCMLIENTYWLCMFVLASGFVFIIFYFFVSFLLGIQIATFRHVRCRNVYVSWIWFNTKQFLCCSPAFYSFSEVRNMNTQVIFNHLFLAAQAIFRTKLKTV